MSICTDSIHSRHLSDAPAMSKGPFQVAIADLEKSHQHPDILLDKAAKLINVNLQQQVSSCSEHVQYQHDAVSAGFKEQWLLRWLLKKLTVPVEGANAGDVSALENRYVFTYACQRALQTYS